MSLSSQAFPKNIHFFLLMIGSVFHMYIRLLLLLYDYYMLYKTKKKKWQDKLCISMEKIRMWKTRQEFSTMTL